MTQLWISEVWVVLDRFHLTQAKKTFYSLKSLKQHPLYHESWFMIIIMLTTLTMLTMTSWSSEPQQVERSVVEAVLHRLFALLQDGAMEAWLEPKQGNVREKKVAFRLLFQKSLLFDTNYICITDMLLYIILYSYSIIRLYRYWRWFWRLALFFAGFSMVVLWFDWIGGKARWTANAGGRKMPKK